MKVSERIKQIQDCSIVEQGVFICRLAQLEAEIVAALQTARQEGYQAGLDWMLNGKEGVDVEALQAARQEGFQAGRYINDTCGRG